VPIAVRDRADLTADGIAAYLCAQTETDRHGLRAALFLVNGRAEPLDFVFSRADLPGGVLWRAADARRRATRELIRTLFTSCPGKPDVVLARAEELPLEVFAEDLDIDVCCARLSTGHAQGNERVELLGDRVYASWSGAAPDPDSPARRLVEQLAGCGMLTEPFERAVAGLDEALAS
jgi:hypothetical protein